MHGKLFVSLPRQANEEGTVSPTDNLRETGYPHTGETKIDPYLIPSKKFTEHQRLDMKNPLKLNHNLKLNQKKNSPIEIWLKGFK